MICPLGRSAIELCLKLCPWVTFHHGIGAIKMHAMIDLIRFILTFIFLIEGAVHDFKIKGKVPIEAKSNYFKDKRYVKFDAFYQLLMSSNLEKQTNSHDS